MVILMQYFNLCELARNLAKELMDEELFRELMDCKKSIDQNCQEEIRIFKQTEAKYLEAKEYGIYHPDFKKYKDAFLIAKDNLFSQPLVKKYKELERLFQAKLVEVSDTIKRSIRSQ